MHTLAAATRLALPGAPLAVAARSAPVGEERPHVDITGTAAPPLTRVTEDIAASPADVAVRKELDAKTFKFLCERRARATPGMLMKTKSGDPFVLSLYFRPS